MSVLAKGADGKRTYSYSADTVYTAALSALQNEKGFSVKRYDEAAKTIEAKTGASMRTFGEAITIKICGTSAESCDVSVSSELLAPALTDGGKNKANVNRILELIAGALKKKQQTPSVYHVVGSSGSTLDVYEEKCVITTKASLTSWATGNSSDGEKTIYYVDCIGVQFKRCGTGLTIGYLQLETASGLMNQKTNNFWNENSFTFNKEEQNEQVAEIADYIKEKIDEIKRQKSAPQATTVVQQASAADELKKFKELLDMGVITQEEFDAKKKQLLGL